MIRNYPVRFSRQSWRIHLFAREPLHKSSVHLSKFRPSSPHAISGPLQNTCSYVIPDSEIRLRVGYPVTRPCTFRITTADPDGFTLGTLLQKIRRIFRYIYKEEERTCTSMQFELAKVCTACMNKDFIQKSVVPVESDPEDACSICCEPMKKTDACRMSCAHVFHDRCLARWIMRSMSCPLCRTAIADCKSCGNSRLETFQYTGKVVPREMRGMIRHRNSTDGTFGIRDFDFENIFITGLHYDRRQRLLTLDLDFLVNSELLLQMI
jgi:hypothetical protein